MAGKTITTYRMSVPDPETGVRAVNKVVRKIDGKADYIQLEKKVAPTLEAFREMWPREPVEGAPRGDELKVITGELTDEQLEELGLMRVDDPAPVETPSVFASEEAERLAGLHQIDPDELPEGEGNGSGGTYNTSDIRFMVAQARGTSAPTQE